MKKLIFALSLVLGIVSVLPSKASAEEYTDYVKTFNSEITLNQDASISVNERIDYHFVFARHGIYREIPVSYKTSGGLTRPTLLKLKNLYYFQKDYPFDKLTYYDRSSSNGFVVFKIGDGDTTITGDYTFILDYKLIYAINYFDDHDELYINITGTGWEVPINEVISNITVPGEITNKLCYTGVTDSKETNCTMAESGENKITVKANSLNIHEGVTVVLAMPKGTIADTTHQQRVQAVLSNLGFFLPILAIIAVLILSPIVNKNKKLTIIPNYDVPKGFNPLSAGYLYKKNLVNSTITAQIIHLAINKYIKIKQVSKKDYELIKTEKEAPQDKNEKILYEGLFGSKEKVSLKNLSNKFYNVVQTLKASVDGQLYEDNYLSSRQKKIQALYYVVPIIIMSVAFSLVRYFVENAAVSWLVGILLSGAVIFVFAYQIDKRTVEGNELFYELEGLKLYIKTAEEHRIEFHNNPKKYLGLFEKLLPYAMIFGLEKKWAKEFEDIYIEQPSWYEGNTGLFNSYLMMNSLNHMNQQVISHTTPSNSASGFSSSHGGSGGSGFSGGGSGGGFGGGGGGSW